MRIPASARTVLYPLQSYLLYPEPEKLVEWMSVFPTRLTIVSTLKCAMKGTCLARKHGIV